MHADTLDIDLVIREFEGDLAPLFDGRRREMTLLQSRIILAAKNHKSTNELQRQLVLMRCMELVGA
jgi:hypothetical protein